MRPSASSSNTPQHVAIIMDGNGRWAQARGLSRTAGHRQGVEALKRVVESAVDVGIKYLTLFGFSSENWGRPLEEISDILGLLRLYLKGHLADIHKENICLRVIGDRGRLPKDIVDLISAAEQTTASNKGLCLTIAFSYGGRQDMTEACRRVATDVLEGKLKMSDITEERVSRYLSTAQIPDPDLLIRTSNEKRLSNFLLWQMAYTELVFVDTLWPDFSRADLERALQEYGQRERRYGAVKALV